MCFTRMQFFGWLFVFMVLPFFFYKVAWLLSSAPAAGTVCFMGKTINGQMSSTYPVIRFSSNGLDTVFFHGTDEAVYKPGEPLPVRYRKSNPEDARINSFTGIWQDTLIYALFPFILLLIIFLHPDIVPRGAKVIICKKPFIRLAAVE